MPQFYVVKGIGGGFDGLVIEAVATQEGNLVEVLKFVDRDSVVGDRNVSLPIPGQSIYMDKRVLDEIEDPGIREFSSTNPYGRLQLEGRMDCGGLQVVYAQYELALTVVVTDMVAKRTVLSQNFSKDFGKVKAKIEECLKQADAEDLVFQLRALKEAEVNG